ncbi:RICIN domain-containing protein [Streptomyces sp. NPDC004610]|uniref:RICIN domain-containing protein n=1 Tax=unclassified Streptomyces TaxID=2593676 RepID=UPI0033B1F7F9
MTAVLATLLLACLALLGGGTAAQAANADSHVVATWNMQAGPNQWGGAYTLARDHDTVALQEVPQGHPAGATFQGLVNGVEHYLWVEGNGPLRHLFILRTTSRHLGMITTYQPDSVQVIQGVYRPALAVVNEADNVMFASVHAASGGGNDAGSLLRRIEQAAMYGNFLDWVALGDFNRSPQDLAMMGVPPGARIYHGGQATQLSGNELDYMVSDVHTNRWQATVLPNHGSDHWPIRFGSLQAAAGPVDLTIHADNSDRVLDVYQDERANGTHVIQYQNTAAVNQQWQLRPLGITGESGRPMYRIVSKASGKCLDVDSGPRSGAGDYLNIWDCHPDGGDPGQGAPHHDTQNFTLEEPNPTFPNLTALRNEATGLYANINNNETQDGAWVIQWPYEQGPNGPDPVANETFFLHPTV